MNPFECRHFAVFVIVHDGDFARLRCRLLNVELPAGRDLFELDAPTILDPDQERLPSHIPAGGENDPRPILSDVCPCHNSTDFQNRGPTLFEIATTIANIATAPRTNEPTHNPITNPVVISSPSAALTPQSR